MNKFDKNLSFSILLFHAQKVEQFSSHAIKFSLEEALEYIQKDEYVEVTPSHLRLRKIYLKEVDRKRNKAL